MNTFFNLASLLRGDPLSSEGELERTETLKDS